MKQSDKKWTMYDDSLPKIFLKSGSTVCILLLIVLGIIYLLMLHRDYPAAERMNLMTFLIAAVVPFSYGRAAVCLFRVWKQERTLGKYWKDRADRHRPMQERDWYLDYDLCGFVLYHRDYIRKIVETREKEQTTSEGRNTVYYVLTQDIHGKNHSLKFSSRSTRQRFLDWYERQMPADSDEDEGTL